MLKKTDNLFSFGGYKQRLTQLANTLKKLRDYSINLELVTSIKLIDDVLQRIETGSFSIAVVGEFNRGKSTFVNALLGGKILPADALPTTATLNRIVYGEQSSAKIIFQDDSEKEISIEQLAEYVTKLTEKSAAMAATVKEAVVSFPLRYGQKKLEIVDTPGLSDDAEIDEMTLAILPRVDAAIFVLMVESPLSLSEQNYLKNNLLDRDLGRIIFVVNGADRFRHQEDANRIVKLVKHRLQNQLLARAEQEYGKNSSEYQAYLSRIGQLKVFSVSSLQALQAKLEDDRDLLGKSRFLELESALERLLIEERGIVLLQVAINRAIAAAEEIALAIARQTQKLKQERTQLTEIYENAVAEIELKTERKREQIERVYQLDKLSIDELICLEKDLFNIEQEFSQIEELKNQIPKLHVELVLHQSVVDSKQKKLNRLLQEIQKTIEESRFLLEQTLQIIGVFCHQCGKMNQPGAKFCLACGTQIVCPNCGRSSFSNTDKCSYCDR